MLHYFMFVIMLQKYEKIWKFPILFVILPKYI